MVSYRRIVAVVTTFALFVLLAFLDTTFVPKDVEETKAEIAHKSQLPATLVRRRHPSGHARDGIPLPPGEPVTIPPPTEEQLKKASENSVKLPPLTPAPDPTLPSSFRLPMNEPDMSKKSFDEQKEDLFKCLQKLNELKDTCVSPKDQSSCRSRAGGALYYVEHDALQRKAFGWPQLLRDRLQNPVTDIVQDTLNQMMGKLKENRTFVHFLLEDHDVWYHVRLNPQTELAKEVRRTTARHPNLYWVHWNPTLLDEKRGLLGPNTVPVPHFEAIQHQIRGLTKPWGERTRGVAWRGATTGFFNPYSASDRWRVVKAFEGVPHADVKFHARVQGINHDDVPESMMGGHRHSHELMNHQVLLDVDGNANAWEGLRWKLMCGGTVVKAKSIYYAQWYYPWMTHGQELFVADIDDIVSQAIALAADEDSCNEMSRVGREFAEKHLSQEAAREATASIIRHIWDYSVPKDWRIQKSDIPYKITLPPPTPSPAPMRIPELLMTAAQAKPDIVARLQRLRHMRSKGEAGGSRLAGYVMYTDGNGNAELLVDLGDAGSRRANPVSSIFDSAFRKLTLPTFVHFGLEDHDVWYHVRFDPDCELSKGIVELTEKHPNFFWVHWNPTLVNETSGTIGTRAVPVPHFETLQKDESGTLPPVKDRKAAVCWRGTTTGFFNPYNLSDRYRVVKQFLPMNWADVKFYSRCQGVGEDIVTNDMMAGTMEKNEFASFRVTLDIDGNANAWESLRWKLRYGATVVKAKSVNFIQWYYPFLTNGKELVVANIDSITEEAKTVLEDVALCDSMAKAAKAFGNKHLSSSAAGKAINQIVENIYAYQVPRDWRIQNSPA